MNSFDFSTFLEAVADCIQLAVSASLSVLVIGGLAWALSVVLGNTSSEPALTLIGPFFFAVLGGNIAIYNTRWKYRIRVLGGLWWCWLTGFAIVWSFVLMAMALGMESLLYWFGMFEGRPGKMDAVPCLLGAAGFALVFSLIPAKKQISV